MKEEGDGECLWWKIEWIFPASYVKRAYIEMIQGA